MADRIEIKKEDLSALYGRFRRNPNPPRPPASQVSMVVSLNKIGIPLWPILKPLEE